MKLPPQLNFLHSARQPILRTTCTSFNKTIVLTGATSGIGYVTALAFAKLGAQLILVARNQEKADKVAQECLQLGANVKVVIADLSLLAQVHMCAQTILSYTNRIDVLIHNAGMHATRKTFTSEGFETVFALNHLAPLLLTHLLLEPLKVSPSAHVLLINSEGHRFNSLDLNDLHWKRRIYTGLRSYGASKTAQLLAMLHLNTLLQSTAVVVNAMHPGDVKTNIGSNNGWLYRLFSRLVIQPSLKDPYNSAQAIVAIVTTPSLATVRNAFYHLTTLEEPAKHTRDESKAKAVYMHSCALCQIEPLDI